MRDSLISFHAQDQLPRKNQITTSKFTNTDTLIARLEILIDNYGFPSKKSIGQGDAYLGLVFLLLHSDEQTMTKYLDCVLKFKFFPQLTALYIDKLSIYRTGSQIIGTQKDALGNVFPLLYPDKIDSLRMVYGFKDD